MAPRSRHVVDPSLLGGPQTLQPVNFPAHPNQQQSQLHAVEPQYHAQAGSYYPQSSSSQLVQPSYQAPQQASNSHYASHLPPANHIEQPPHSSGPRLRGLRSKLDPSQIPNPLEIVEQDQALFSSADFHSCNTKGTIPVGGTDYRGVDEGNSLPRFIRSTLNLVPVTGALLDTSQLPFGLVIQPFAPLRYDEDPIPYVTDFGGLENQSEDEGPPRCEKCRGYVNPWVRWFEGGNKWQCNLCNAITPVPAYYHSHLGHDGRRLDIATRPELNVGTVDFAVPKSYWALQPRSILEDGGLDSTADLMGALTSAVSGPSSSSILPAPTTKDKAREKAKQDKRMRRPRPLGRVFAIDVSYGAVRSGLLHETCHALKTILFAEDAPTQPVAIMTFDRSVQFYNLSPLRPQAEMLVVSDLDDMFVPLADGFLVDPAESRSQIEGLLDSLPRMYEHTVSGEIALGAAVTGLLSGLKKIGGQAVIILSGLPTAGPGALKPRDESTAGTDKERHLFSAADPFWRITGEELAEAGVGVNIFFMNQQYTDVASVGTLAAVTGGESFSHPKYDPVRDRSRFTEELRSVVTRDTAYNATLRIRCSNGLRVAEHYGNFYQRSLTDLEFGLLDSSKAIAASIKHEGPKLNDRERVFFQVATLYTAQDGSRRVRCINLALEATVLIGNLFKFSDLDPTVTLLAKEAMTLMTQKPLQTVRQSLTDKCTRLLLMYRRHCATGAPSGELVLPESFGLLPLYILCLQKSKPLKDNQVISDVRSHFMRLLKSASVTTTMVFLYPRMIAIHDLADHVGFAGPDGRLVLPSFMRLAHDYMLPDAAYLIINGQTSMLWFGHAVNPQILDDLLAVDNFDEVDIRISSLPKLPTMLSTQVRNILTHFERVYGNSLSISIARQNVDGIEIEFANLLVEDNNNGALAYPEYLMQSHHLVAKELTGSGGGLPSEGWRPW